jgi:hypothetical protein
MPSLKASSISNVYFAGDIVRTRHGSWSQEKAFVTGREAANIMMGKPVDDGLLPVGADELHVSLGRKVVAIARKLIGGGAGISEGPSLVDFLW